MKLQVESELAASNASKWRYMPGLDGLRALSVLAVIVYHLNSSWLPGGLLGVGVFFTLSGYLITDQLLIEWQSTRRIDLKGFWIKRVRRLMPAMIFMLAIVSLWLLIFDRTRLFQLQGDFVSVFLYFNNWWLIFHKVSYFESWGPPSPIGHLWSLAIEEQFYFIWPLVLALVLRWVNRRGIIFVLTLVGVLASILVMAFVYQPGMDPSRVYYGTDTRAFALLIGGALAVIWPSKKIAKQTTGKSSVVLDLVGGAGLVGILVMMFTTNAYNASLYVGGLALFSVICAIVIAVVTHPASLLGKVMGSKPLRWLGKRSYSLYIWHYPVIVLTSTSLGKEETHMITVLLQMLLSFILAAFSYACIEEPFRRGVIQRQLLTDLRSPVRLRYVLMVTILPIQLFVISCSSNLFDVKSSASAATIHSEVTTVNTTATDSSPNVPLVSISQQSSSATLSTYSPSLSQAIVQSPTPTTTPPPTEAPPKPQVENDQMITAIGDSVILDAAPFLEKLLPGIVVDGKIGRQMSQLQGVIDELRSKNLLGKRIIIELGTNGAFNPDQLRSVLTSLGDMKQIILVNTRVPRDWQNQVNATLSKVASEFPQATVVDWYKASKGKEKYFAQDGVHLKEEGASSYASLLSEAVLRAKK